MRGQREPGAPLCPSSLLGLTDSRRRLAARAQQLSATMSPIRGIRAICISERVPRTSQMPAPIVDHCAARRRCTTDVAPGVVVSVQGRGRGPGLLARRTPCRPGRVGECRRVQAPPPRAAQARPLPSVSRTAPTSACCARASQPRRASRHGRRRALLLRELRQHIQDFLPCLPGGASAPPVKIPLRLPTAGRGADASPACSSPASKRSSMSYRRAQPARGARGAARASSTRSATAGKGATGAPTRTFA